jgi:hypothetical protein
MHPVAVYVGLSVVSFAGPNILLLRGSLVVKALCYKPEGCGFETRLGELMF